MAKNLLTLALTFAVTLAAMELLLRIAVAPDQLVPNVPQAPALNERRNELRFLERHADRRPEDLGAGNPWLGWDAGEQRIGIALNAVPTGMLHAVAVGDSFVYGNEVEAADTFTTQLTRSDNGLVVSNLGVPGYGIDQSHLIYERRGAVAEPDIVLFGIYVSDYERSTVAFTAGPKPAFRHQGATVALGNQPVPAPAERLAALRADLAGSFHLKEFVASLITALGADPGAYFDGADRIVTHILHRQQKMMRPSQRLVVIHFPRGESFTAADPFHDQMDARLRAIYSALDLEFVDLARVFLDEAPAEAVAERFYVVRPSGSVGHLNPTGHAATATAIARHLDLKSDLPPEAPPPS